eukprot:CAMPEP_0197250896 /NCGR_PEP_ID=MMETSP1429-20130617/54831_1 /TAXON_ID=49237 /ORGANISM="Chaetoceros  sp., Strain UNC1202" /LENGTH=143 /DNA_ID=CAMNT_0042712841 /DNA_START=21 /DNA_END=452 /DNA_ORIENTATION=+
MVARSAVLFKTQPRYMSSIFNFMDYSEEETNTKEANIKETMTEEKNTRDDNLNRTHFAQMIAEEHDLSYAKSIRIVDSVFDTIVESVAEGKKVSVSNFGRFETKLWKETVGRNPKTGQVLNIPARKRVKFSASKAFKDAVNEH